MGIKAVRVWLLCVCVGVWVCTGCVSGRENLLGTEEVRVSKAAGKGRGRPASFTSSPVAVFQGYDTVTGSGLPMALTGISEKSGGYSRVSYRVCSGIEELKEEMGITESLAATFGSFGTISQKLEFVDSLKLTTHSTCIVVSAKHIMGKTTATDYSLKPDIVRPTDDAQLKEFFTVYGDSFVSARTLGGEYYAVYTFYAETQDRQSELTAELRAEGLLSVVSVDASLQVKLSKVSSTQTTRVSLDQIVTGMANPYFPTADKMIQYALDFPSLELTSPVVVRLETTGYEHVPWIGTHFDVIAANRNLFVGLEPKLVLLKHLQNDISEISSIYSFYGGYDADSKLVQVKQQAEADATAVLVLVRVFKANPTQALGPPAFYSLANGSPSLNYGIQKTDFFTQARGEPFDDIDRRAYLQQKTRINALQVGYGADVVTYFKVTYTNTQGSWVAKHGSATVPGSTLSDELLLEPGHVVVSAVSGNIAYQDSRLDYWRSLGFSVSDGRHVFYGNNYPVGFTWTVPQGSFLLGFTGLFASDPYLAELECIYATFPPAYWSMP